MPSALLCIFHVSRYLDACGESAGELAERQQKLGFMMSRLRKVRSQPASAASPCDVLALSLGCLDSSHISQICYQNVPARWLWPRCAA